VLHAGVGEKPLVLLWPKRKRAPAKRLARPKARRRALAKGKSPAASTRAV
jgi:hypothetical protein